MTLVWRPGYLAEGDPYFSNVSLLLHGNGTNGSTTIIDSSPSPKTVTAFGNAQISTAQSKFGGASLLFDGFGDYLLSTSSDFVLGAGDFTIEAFVYANTASSYRSIMGITSGGQGGMGFAMNGTSEIVVTTPGISVDHTFAISVLTQTWFHVALTRAQGSLRLFVNGSQAGTTQDNSKNYNQNRLVVGVDVNLVGQAINAYIDELRITKGVARYTANFTPPDAQFPDAQY
jgi:hypothetical protein